mmetsp:Transcript_6761/g.7375  ORF Transcript_6761/g.7375 Transcript_6761/m.7375 type:complete len:217 (-) Transcript_6761:146-796(-)|eukprot:gene1399-1484_t
MSYESTLDVGDEVPGFDLESQLGKIYFKDIVEAKWSLLVTFASAFDPVTTTDFGLISRLFEEFEARNILLLAVGNETASNIRMWIKEIEELQTVKIKFPIMSDPTCTILKMFGCARDHVSLKKPQPISNGGFLIDVDRRIRYSSRSSVFIGRNWYEFLRQYDALMMVIYHPIACPANWAQGQQVMIKKDVATSDAADYRCVEIKPWFRLAPCPEKL